MRGKENQEPSLAGSGCTSKCVAEFDSEKRPRDPPANDLNLIQAVPSPVTEPDASVYPFGVRLALISTSLCLCVFLTGLDSTILTTAIPRITDEFGSVDDVGWYDAAFRLTSSMCQLTQGKLFSKYSIKWVFMVNLAIFQVGSLVCGFAPSSSAFIVGRAVTGLGFSGISQGCMVIMALSRPLHQRPTYIGLISSSEFIAVALAPLIGGALTTKLNWRWCFYILPMAAAPADIALFLMTLPKHSAQTRGTVREQIEDLDIVGVMFLAPGIFCFLLALQWGGSSYGWGTARIIALLITSVVLLSGFVLVERKKEEQAMLPPRVIRRGTILVGSMYSLCLTSSLAIAQYYLPIWFQTVRGASPLKSGVDTLPLVVGVLLLAVFAGWIISRLGYYMPVMTASSLCVVAGVALMATFSTTTPARIWIPALALLGIGVGGGIACPFIAAQAVLNPEDISIGMAIMTFSQDFGESVFISVAQSIFLNKLKRALKSSAPALNWSVIIQLGATSLVGKIPSQDVAGTRHAYNQSIKEAFYLALSLAAILTISGFLMKNRSIKPKEE